MPPVPSEEEISPLRFASVEMTIGVSAATVISSGGFMRRLSRGVLFCPLHRGKSGAARIGGGERSEPIRRMLIMSYDTDSQSRNVLASPLGEEGHEVAKGWTVVRMIMILDVDVTAAGGIIKLIARRAIPPPFEPACQRQAEPSEPSEPGPQSGPYIRPFPSRYARHSPSEWQAMLNHLRAHRKVCPCFDQ